MKTTYSQLQIHMNHRIIGALTMSLIASVTNAQTLRSDVSLSDPAIMADPVSNCYYMTGTGGDIFKSTDLEIWTKQPWAINTNGIEWIGKNHTAPSPGQIWAPELYYKNGAYYDVVTFTNPNAKTEGTNHSRRSIHILKSDKPEGPFSRIEGGDALYLPATKMAIDGTIWEEDGKLYLIYCYEWVQAGDGAIEYIELKSDLTGTIGESRHICRASDGRAWNTDAVTDGCFMFRTQTGRLGMIWTGWRSGVYVQGVSYSDNGKLSGKWSHSKCPVTPDNHGHGMLFRTFGGQLLMSIHSNRNIDLAAQHFERHPELFVVDDSSDELRVVMQYKKDYSLNSPANVMVLNAGFDYSTTGWTNTTDAENRKIASNQSGAITGKFYESWGAKSFTGEIYQELKVPNGTYRLTAAAFAGYLADGAKEESAAVQLFANSNTCNITSATPQDYSVTTFVSDGTLRIGIRSNKKVYQWMGIDNVCVKYYGVENISPDSIEEFENGGDAVYIKNELTGKYLNGGQSWGTQAILSPHALDLYLVELPNGKYAIDSKLSNGGGNHYAGTNGYLDSGLTEFKLTKRSTGTWLIANGTKYWGGSTSSDIVQTNLTNPNATAAQWSILRKSDLIAEFADATIENPIDATFLIKGGNFGRNDTRIAANWHGTFETGGDVKNQCMQPTENSFDIYQTLINIPNGVYEVKAQGFFQYSSATLAATYREMGKERLQASLYANGQSTPLMSIFEHADHASIPTNESTSTKCGTIPASLKAASAMFSAGLYDNNKILVEVTDNTLHIGIKKSTSTAGWTVADNFRLSYLGKEFPSSIGRIEHTGQTSATDGTYDLSGRKTSATQSGIHIIVENGKSRKVIK